MRREGRERDLKWESLSKNCKLVLLFILRKSKYANTFKWIILARYFSKSIESDFVLCISMVSINHVRRVVEYIIWILLVSLGYLLLFLIIYDIFKILMIKDIVKEEYYWP